MITNLKRSYSWPPIYSDIIQQKFAHSSKILKSWCQKNSNLIQPWLTPFVKRCKLWNHWLKLLSVNRLKMHANQTMMRLFYWIDTIQKKLERLTTTQRIYLRIILTPRSLLLSQTGPTVSCILLPFNFCNSSRTKKNPLRERRTWNTKMMFIHLWLKTSLTWALHTEDIKRLKTSLCSNTSNQLMLATNWCEYQIDSKY